MRFRTVSFFSLVLLLVGCTTIEWTGVYSRYIGRQSKYDDAIRGLNKKTKGEKNKITKMGYLLLAGIAYQKKGLLEKSIGYYNKSLSLNSNFNYFSYIQKAEIFRIKKEKKHSLSNYRSAISCIENLKKGIVKKQISSKDIKLYMVLDHYIGYNIYHEKIDQRFQGNTEKQRKNFIYSLNKRIDIINRTIKSNFSSEETGTAQR